ncbi:MAG TPA: SAM-dependent methyltransferase [Burkholderiaceae bacterium]|jgi:SAM-dependent methyltransferase
MQADALVTFLALVEEPFAKLVLSKPRAAMGDLARVTVRPVMLKGMPQLSFVYSHATRDITKNLAPADALATLSELLANGFGDAHLWAADEEVQLLTSKKGRHTLLRQKTAVPAPERASHDREKHRYVDVNRPFLTALGVTDEQHRLVPAMARKWKQINKFVEVLDHALAGTALKQAARLDVVDFGSGKGYLTFATHEHLRHALGLPAFVAGVELREDMVALCNGAAQRLGLEGLRFEQGDVRSIAPPQIDIMIALHACDTATDHAIHTGLRAGASIIMCSPCCHKELRPQLLSPHPLRPLLKHGVHLGQQAEMLTDGLRALLLEACGYETQVFEFVALEHTNKNKMILAVRRAAASPAEAEAAWRQIDDLKAFYGVRDQCLETLLRGAHATIPADLASRMPR